MGFFRGQEMNLNPKPEPRLHVSVGGVGFNLWYKSSFHLCQRRQPDRFIGIRVYVLGLRVFSKPK